MRVVLLGVASTWPLQVLIWVAAPLASGRDFFPVKLSLLQEKKSFGVTELRKGLVGTRSSPGLRGDTELAGKGRERARLMSVRQRLLLQLASLQPGLQQLSSLLSQFYPFCLFLPSCEMVTKEGVGILDSAAFSIARRVEIVLLSTGHWS